MSRLEEILKEHFPNHKTDDKWDIELLQFDAGDMMDFAKIYAEECVKASLEKASERTKILFDPKFNGYKGRHLSITNPENIVLL